MHSVFGSMLRMCRVPRYIDEIGLVHVPDAPVEDRYEPYAAAQLQDGQAFSLSPALKAKLVLEWNSVY